MNSSATTKLDSRILATVGCALSLALAASEVSAIEGPDAGRAAPIHDPCTAELKSPKLLATSPVTLPSALWERKTEWQARVHFRVDENGTPWHVNSTVSGGGDDKRALEEAVNDAFRRHRFCRPGDFSTQARWLVRLDFAPARAFSRESGVETYVQSFMPGYTAAEKVQQHVGRAVVLAVYGTDGKPRSVELVTSSGDKALDDKSLDAMASDQLLFRDGAVPTGPIRLQRPFNYRRE